ncbi:MAG: tetratricopeptide repeat protein [Kiloniellales bacterium]
MLAAGCAELFEPEPIVTSAGPVLVAAADGHVSGEGSPLIGSPYGSYLAGLFAGRRRDLGIAADFMLEALAYDPENERLLNRAFMLNAGDGRHAKAVELAGRLTAIDPDHSLALLALIVDAVGRGAYADAESYLGRLPNKGLSTVSVPLIGSWLKAAEGEIDAALERAKPLENKSGFAVFYKLHTALINDLGGRTEAARAAYEEAIDVAGQPTLRLTWLAGNFFERAGDPVRTKEIYEEFLTRNPGSSLIAESIKRVGSGETPPAVVADIKDGVAETAFNLASLLSKERAEEVALIYTHFALHLRPDFVVAHILLGEVLQGQGRGQEAIAAYRQVPADSPFRWTVQLRIAEELARMERIDDALAELESLAELRGNRYEPLFRLGNLLRTEERFEEAVEAYDRAAERIGTPERRHWTLYYFRGIVLERLKRWTRAEKDLLFALELEPEQPFVMNYLAYSWVEKKLNLDQAKGMLVRAVELRPDDGYIVDSLGWVYYRLGEYKKGVTFLERAVELRPQDPVINDHLGDAFWRVGRHQEARFQWRRALSLEPEEDVAPKIEAKIESGLGDSPEDI